MKNHTEILPEDLPEELRNFWEERKQLNAIVFEKANLTIKRFFSLDGQAYRQGVLPAKIKEMLGLVASLVLRCDDCIKYHLIRCHQHGVTDAEIAEAFSVGLVVGGAIVIPHLRRAYRWWTALQTAAR